MSHSHLCINRNIWRYKTKFSDYRMYLLMIIKRYIQKKKKNNNWSMVMSWLTKCMVYYRVLGVEHKICFWFLSSRYFVVGPSLWIEKRMINKMDVNWPHTNLLKLWIIIIVQNSSTVKIGLARWWWGRGIASKSIYQKCQLEDGHSKNTFNSKLSTHIIRITLSEMS